MKAASRFATASFGRILVKTMNLLAEVHRKQPGSITYNEDLLREPRHGIDIRGASSRADKAPTTAGDYRLKAGSAAVEAGDNSYFDAGLTKTDLDGNPRIFADKLIWAHMNSNGIRFPFLRIRQQAAPLTVAAYTVI